MRKPPLRSGYVFLISVLVIGAIAAAATVSLLLLAGAAQRTAGTIEQSAQALENARSCVERTIRTLQNNLAEAGGESMTLTRGTCLVHRIGGSGNSARTICVEGQSGGASRRLEVKIDRLFPSVTVSVWREVPVFTLCP